MRNRKELTYLDLVVARILWDNRNLPPTQRELFDIGRDDSLVNGYLDEHGIGEDRASPIKTTPVLVASIKRLRDAGLLTSRGPYQTTAKMQSFWKRLGSNPHRWPQWIPYARDIEFQAARNLPRVRV